ncbi:hypothetical protein [Acinetobacter sp. ANC 5502]
MSLSKEQKAFILEKLNHQYSSVKVKCNGYEISLCLERVAKTKLAINVYVDGFFKSVWLFKPDEHIESKFYPTLYKSYYSAKQKAELTKIWGKREVKKRCDLDVKYEYKLPFFNSARSALNHLIKVSDSIDLITEMNNEKAVA